MVYSFLFSPVPPYEFQRKQCLTEALTSGRIEKTRRKNMGSTEKRPALSQALLEKLIYIEDHKGPDGWTDAPISNVLVFHSSGTKVKLSGGGLFLVKWCR